MKKNTGRIFRQVQIGRLFMRGIIAFVKEYLIASLISPAGAEKSFGLPNLISLKKWDKHPTTQTKSAIEAKIVYQVISIRLNATIWFR